ncbi:MAG: hypothetical protein HXX08_12625 [Chloroflexi bacterium]|uniref:Uncharacterized protein n=1 Tax=Candidatus Chlorohelix allophototropha TaxID=3003348 RepID=A0A8T7M3R1_9CHLR|nr:hypothetical protein [Chloroflexota bacterium]WJW66087.1 hypothetical protein OZ401_001871 [Chloroflexota bacterium L227-S17]
MQNNNEPSKQPNADRKPPGWARITSYILVGLALFLTLVYDQLTEQLGIPSGVLEVSALTCLVIGAVLFLFVKERHPVDRTNAYKEIFRRELEDIKKDEDEPK